jgi:hypothetical protein
MDGRNAFFLTATFREPQDMLNWTVVSENQLAWTKLSEAQARIKAQACKLSSSRFSSVEVL